MKKIYAKFVAFIFLICSSHLALAQENYLPGIIVTPKGDTLMGFIDYRNWRQNPKKISFKKEITGTSATYTPDDISVFKVSNDVYERGFVNIEISPNKIQELDDSSTPQFKADTVFLRNLVFGSKSLYNYYNAKSDKNLYYIKSGSAFELLIYKQYKAVFDNNKVVKSNNLFLNQLSLYLKDCPNITRRLQSVQYNQNSLMKIFDYYYSCTGEKIKVTSADKPRNQFGIVVGPSFGNVHFNGIDFNGKNNYKLNATAVGGIYYNIFLPRSLSKFSIYNDFMFMGYYLQGRSDSYISADNYENRTFEVGYKYIKLNTMLRYNYIFSGFNGFINAGVSNGYAVSEKNKAVTTKKFYSAERVTIDPAFPSASKYEQGILLGIGIGVKKMSSEVRYEGSNGFINAMGRSNTVHRYSFLLGYRF